MKNMKNILILIGLVNCLFICSAQKYYGGVGQEEAFNAKYKMTAKIDEKKNVLSYETNAPIVNLVFSTYTKEELAVRKGQDYTYGFEGPTYTYYFDLNQENFKDAYAYWLKVYTEDGLFQECFFKKKSEEATETKPKPTAENTDYNNLDGYTLIKTNINCDKGSKSVMDELKNQEGVFDVKVDTKTGNLYLQYSSDGTPYTSILEMINSKGFTAEGQKSKVKNPCK